MSFKINYLDKILTFDKPTKVIDIVGNDKSIICVKVNNRIRELTYTLNGDANIVALTTKDQDAKQTYEASLRYILSMAMKNIHPELRFRLSFHISRTFFLQILNEGISATPKLVNELNEEMKRIVSLDIPLIRHIIPKEEARILFDSLGYNDKRDILKYRPEVTAHIYSCNGYQNYMYNKMVPSTGYINRFKLLYYAPGIVIQYPRADYNGEIPPFEDAPTFNKVLKRAREQALITGSDSVLGINERIEKYGPVDVISLAEAEHSRQLAELGDMIEEGKDDIKLICVAGPSSSGKTTFANKLRIELLSRGFNPIRISLDDYYISRDKIPLDENGEKDFETIEALDIDYFNKNMIDLISGETVTLPKFDFQLGHRMDGRTLKLDKNSPIIVEGIHALNDLLTPSIPSHQKFKIFIAPQAQINIDDHNPLSLTDLRLLRRIVRDNKFRNADAITTLSMWPSVRKGEFKWIYKTQEGANYVFNSLLSYELPVMKKYAMPLLKNIPVESEYFPVVERLIRMLKYFVDLNDEWVPCNSLIREFIGGSCYSDI